MSVMRIRSPSVQRMVGPGMRPLYVQAGYSMPGTISIFLLMTVISYLRSSAVGQGGDLAVIKIGQDIPGIEAVFFVVNVPGSGDDTATMLHLLDGGHGVLIFTIRSVRGSRACRHHTIQAQLQEIS